MNMYCWELRKAAAHLKIRPLPVHWAISHIASFRHYSYPQVHFRHIQCHQHSAEWYSCARQERWHNTVERSGVLRMRDSIVSHPSEWVILCKWPTRPNHFGRLENIVFEKKKTPFDVKLSNFLFGKKAANGGKSHFSALFAAAKAYFIHVRCAYVSYCACCYRIFTVIMFTVIYSIVYSTYLWVCPDIKIRGA